MFDVATCRAVAHLKLANNSLISIWKSPQAQRVVVIDAEHNVLLLGLDGTTQGQVKFPASEDIAEENATDRCAIVEHSSGRSLSTHDALHTMRSTLDTHLSRSEGELTHNARNTQRSCHTVV